LHFPFVVSEPEVIQFTCYWSTLRCFGSGSVFFQNDKMI
jgi:hypothetical protein